jgi:hypothetical protein
VSAPGSPEDTASPAPAPAPASATSDSPRDNGRAATLRKKAAAKRTKKRKSLDGKSGDDDGSEGGGYSHSLEAIFGIAKTGNEYARTSAKASTIRRADWVLLARGQAMPELPAGATALTQ